MDEKEYVIDLAEIWAILKENRKPIVRMTGLAAVAGLVFLLVAWFLFPKYESVAMLQIRQKNNGSGLGALMVGMGAADFLSPASSSMDSYIEILKSRGVVVPVIEATEKKGLFGKYPAYDQYVERKINAEPAKGSDASALKMSSSNILMVTVNDKSPEKAQHVNQLLIEGFLKRVAELNSAEKGSVKAFLEERLKMAKEDLQNAEAALEKFKVENKILSPSNNAEIFTERIMDAEKRAAANQIELEAAQARLTAINQQLNGSGAANADNVTIQKYNEELAKLESTRIAYQDKYTEKQARMIEINERITNLKAKIQLEVNKIAALQAPSDNEVHQGLVSGKYSAEGAVTVARQKAEALQKIIDQNNADLAKMPAIEQQFVRLSRDYGVANEIYMLLTKQLEQTKITEHQQPTNVLVVDPPHLPDKPVSPKKVKTVLIAVLLGLLGSCSYVIFRGLQHRIIRSAEIITDSVGVLVLGEIPDRSSLLQQTVAEEVQARFFSKVRDFLWKK